MPELAVHGITIDSAHPEQLARWWGEALGWRVEGTQCRPPESSGLPRLEFMPVSEAKTTKNRVHLDLGTDDVEAEIRRLVDMGARVAWEEDFGPDSPYRNVTLQDPEGNEFCVGGPGDFNDDAR